MELEQTELEADCLYELCPALPVTKSCFVTQTCSLIELKVVLRISLRWCSEGAGGRWGDITNTEEGFNFVKVLLLDL